MPLKDKKKFFNFPYININFHCKETQFWAAQSCTCILISNLICHVHNFRHFVPSYDNQFSKISKDSFTFPATGNNSASDRDEVEASIQRLMKHGDGLLPKMEDVKAEEIGDMLENEMAGMTQAIESAAAKIQVWQKFSVASGSLVA